MTLVPLRPRRFDEVWPLGGYAPGNYMCQCRDCGVTFDGDKRAMVCLECAVIGAKAQLANAASARLAALEEAAKVAEQCKPGTMPIGKYGSGWDDACDYAATAIRALSNKTGEGSGASVGAAWGFRAIEPTSAAHAAVLGDLARRIDDE